MMNLSVLKGKLLNVVLNFWLLQLLLKLYLNIYTKFVILNFFSKWKKNVRLIYFMEIKLILCVWIVNLC